MRHTCEIGVGGSWVAWTMTSVGPQKADKYRCITAYCKSFFFTKILPILALKKKRKWHFE